MANAEFKMKRIMPIGITCCICILLLADPAEPQQLRNRSSGLTQFLSSVPTKRSLDAIPQKVTGALRAVLANLADRGIKASHIDKSVVASFSRDLIRFQETGEVQVYVFLSKAPHEKEVSLLEMTGLRVERIQEETKRVQGWISTDKVADLAALDSVRCITQAFYALSRTGSVTTEGDAILRANEVRSASGFDGSGQKVGIISNGVDNWTQARSSGDLPSSIEVVMDNRFGDEGTAMLEIVHDIAPGADLAFAGPASDMDMVDAVGLLNTTAGCNVIADDLFFVSEPMYADGPIARAYEEAYSTGIVGLSACGNSRGNLVSDTFRPSSFLGSSFHDFTGSGDHSLNFRVPGLSSVLIYIHWNDPWDAASHDLKLWLDLGGDLEPDLGDTDQPIFPHPFEGIIELENRNSFSVSTSIAIEDEDGNITTNAPHFKLFLDGAQSIQFGQVASEGEVTSHQASEAVIAVAAIDASDFQNDDTESFSSRGPSRIDFDYVGGQYVRKIAPEFRAKPDIAAIDDVRVTGAGGFGIGFPPRFRGTSAASPHAAGVIALMLQANPNLEPARVKEIFRTPGSGAVDIEDSGFDVESGGGRLDAILAVGAALEGLPRIRLAASDLNPVAGDPIQLDIEVRDASGVLVTSFTGDVQLSSSDPLFASDNPVRFAPVDGGKKEVLVTFETMGNQSLRAEASGFRAGALSFDVQQGPPRVLSVIAEDPGAGSRDLVKVIFSEELDAGSAEDSANYDLESPLGNSVCLTNATLSMGIQSFSDSFPAAFVDPMKWDNDGGESNAFGRNEPSAPFSLELRGGETCTSVPLNLGGSGQFAYSYFWEPWGDGERPDPGEFLEFQYRIDGGVWITKARHEAGDGFRDQFLENTDQVSVSGNTLEVRFRNTSPDTECCDSFFVDDVRIDLGEVFLDAHVVEIALNSDEPCEADILTGASFCLHILPNIESLAGIPVRETTVCGTVLDRVSPSVVAISPPDGTCTNTFSSLTISATDNFELTGLSIDATFTEPPFLEGVDYTIESPTSGILVLNASPSGSLFPDGDYEISIEITDAVGNSQQQDLSITQDTTPPSLIASTPSDQDFTPLLDQVTFTFGETVSPVTGSVLCDGTPFLDLDVSSIAATDIVLQATLPSVSFPDGLCDFVVTVHDCAGNVTTASVSITVDAIPPTVAASDPPDGTSDPYLDCVRFTLADNRCVSPIETMVSISRDGSLLSNSEYDVFPGADRIQVCIASPRDASYVFDIRPVDCAGNIGTSATFEFVDNPKLKLLSVEAGEVGGGSDYVSFVFNDPLDATSATDRANYIVESPFGSILDLTDATLAVPPFIGTFFDSFPTSLVDPNKWLNQGGESITLGRNEPSPPYSLELRGGETCTSLPLDLGGAKQFAYSYFWEPWGDGEQPDAGEFLEFQYRIDGGVWITEARHEADDGFRGQFFENTDLVGVSGNTLEVRFRNTSSDIECCDSFFVDDVEIVASVFRSAVSFIFNATTGIQLTCGETFGATLENILDIDGEMLEPAITAASGSVFDRIPPRIGSVEPTPELVANDITGVTVCLTELGCIGPDPELSDFTVKRDSFVVTSSYALSLSNGGSCLVMSVTPEAPLLPDGNYEVSVLVRDASGNPGNPIPVATPVPEPATTAFIMDTVCPTFGNPPASIADGACLQDLEEVQFFVSDDRSGVDATASVISVTKEGLPFNDWVQEGLKAVFSATPEGRYEIALQAHDFAGNICSSSPIAIGLDRTPPSVATVDPPCGQSQFRVVEIKVLLQDDSEIIDIHVDVQRSAVGEPLNFISQREGDELLISILNPRDGTYELTVASADCAGNNGEFVCRIIDTTHPGVLFVDAIQFGNQCEDSVPDYVDICFDQPMNANQAGDIANYSLSLPGGTVPLDHALLQYDGTRIFFGPVGFNEVTIDDSGLWSENENSTLSDTGPINAEGGRALQLNSNDTLTSMPIDLSGVGGETQIQFLFETGGNGILPPFQDALLVLGATGETQPTDDAFTLLQGGMFRSSDGFRNYFDLKTVDLPEEFHAENFWLRLASSQTSPSSSKNFFVDSLRIVEPGNDCARITLDPLQDLTHFCEGDSLCLTVSGVSSLAGEPLLPDPFIECASVGSIGVGTVVVDVSPENALWSFVDGIGGLRQGIGDTTEEIVPSGEISLTWNPLDKHDLPPRNPDIKNLAAGSTVIFSGFYERHSGTVAISVEPAEATWWLTDGDGVEHMGQGSQSLDRVPTGLVSLEWRPLPFYHSPLSPATMELERFGFIFFSETYERGTGSVNMFVTPENAPWTLTGGDGTNYPGEGSDTIEDVAAGRISITWLDLPLYDTPDPNQVLRTLDIGETENFSERYSRSTGTVVVSVTPEQAPWVLIDGNGNPHEGVGTQVFSMISTGEVFLDWKPLVGYLEPSDPASKTLESATPIFFIDEYRPIGTVVVRHDPPVASWSFIDGNGTVYFGTHETSINDVRGGEIVLTWDPLPGLRIPFPNPATKVLAPNGSIVFDGTYSTITCCPLIIAGDVHFGTRTEIDLPVWSVGSCDFIRSHVDVALRYDSSFLSNPIIEAATGYILEGSSIALVAPSTSELSFRLGVNLDLGRGNRLMTLHFSNVAAKGSVTERNLRWSRFDVDSSEDVLGTLEDPSVRSENIPSTPLLDIPGPEIEVSGFRFNWFHNPEVEEVNRYEASIFEGSAEVFSASVTGNITTVLTGVLSEGTSYLFQLRAVNGSGSSLPAILNFSTLSDRKGVDLRRLSRDWNPAWENCFLRLLPPSTVDRDIDGRVGPLDALILIEE